MSLKIGNKNKLVYDWSLSVFGLVVLCYALSNDHQPLRLAIKHNVAMFTNYRPTVRALADSWMEWIAPPGTTNASNAAANPVTTNAAQNFAAALPDASTVLGISFTTTCPHGLAAAPGALAAPGFPAAPSIPAAPGFPVAPSIPAAPGFPAAPSNPFAPGIPVFL
jgi:hypothetical protein